MRACTRCRGLGTISIEADDFGSGYGPYRRVSRVAEEACPECRGHAGVQPGTQDGQNAAGEPKILRLEIEDWTVADWDWHQRSTALAQLVASSDQSPHGTLMPSTIDKALDLRRTAVGGGATVAQAASALRLLAELTTKRGITDADLDEYEARRA